MPKIKANGINLYYETYGQGEPIVFIGGFSVDHVVWQNIVKKFSEKYQVIIFDNRGAGQSDAPNIPYTVAMMTDDVIGLCEALNIKRAHFIGSSMGGMILQDLAYRYPQYIKSAVLENTAMQTSFNFTVSRQGTYELMVAGASPKALAQISLPWAFSENFLQQPNVLETLIQMTLANPYPMTPTAYKNQLNAVTTFDSRSWVHKINIPCLVTGGDRDIIFNEAKVREMANLIPNALYHCFYGVAHVPHLEMPKQFCELVLGFMGLHD